MKDLPPTLLCHPFSIAVQISEEETALSFVPYSKLNFHISFFFFLKDVTHLHFPVLADQNLLIESKRNQLIMVTLNSSPPLFESSAYSGLIDYM